MTYGWGVPHICSNFQQKSSIFPQKSHKNWWGGKPDAARDSAAGKENTQEEMSHRKMTIEMIDWPYTNSYFCGRFAGICIVMSLVIFYGKSETIHQIDMLMARIHGNTQRRTAAHCNTLQHTATHCNTLQHTATHCDQSEAVALTRYSQLQIGWHKIVWLFRKTFNLEPDVPWEL